MANETVTGTGKVDGKVKAKLAGEFATHRDRYVGKQLSWIMDEANKIAPGVSRFAVVAILDGLEIQYLTKRHMGQTQADADLVGRIWSVENRLADLESLLEDTRQIIAANGPVVSELANQVVEHGNAIRECPARLDAAEITLRKTKRRADLLSDGMERLFNRIEALEAKLTETPADGS